MTYSPKCGICEQLNIFVPVRCRSSASAVRPCMSLGACRKSVQRPVQQPPVSSNMLNYCLSRFMRSVNGHFSDFTHVISQLK